MATHDTRDTNDRNDRNDVNAGLARTSGDDAAALGRLNDLDEYKVADGYPDIRGWSVKTADGKTVGKVGDLIVDTQAMRVRYLDVELDRTVAELARDATTPGDQEQHTLLPIGSVELHDDVDDVLVGGYGLDQIAGFPRYDGRSVTRAYESSLMTRHRAAATGDDARHDYDHDDYDDQRLYARRRQAAGLTGARDARSAEADRRPEGEQRLTLAEEQLSVGKRETPAGEVELRTVVDTERVTEQVQLRHDEVTVERRPITDASQLTGQAQIGADEIRIPIMEERLVVEKKLVPREEIIVRRRAVTEQQTVEADVRRERLDVDGMPDTANETASDIARDRANDRDRR